MDRPSPPMRFTLAVAQLNPHVGALAHNAHTMLATVRRAREQGASLVVFSELVLTGYPPEDLLHKPLFLDQLEETERWLHHALIDSGMDVIYGTVRRGTAGLFNAGVVVQQGRETGFVGKWHLPNFGVFDERRYFVAGRETRLFFHKEVPFGITVCEDIWHPKGPLTELATHGAALTFVLNASPYHVGRPGEREEVVVQRVHETGIPLVYVNQVGGQDELVFDGGSFAVDPTGTVVLRAAFYAEDLQRLHVAYVPNSPAQFSSAYITPFPSREREIYDALCLGLKDYVQKNGFSGVILGLSGGIDSALTAVICADTLGADRVEALMMPSRYTAQESVQDAHTQAQTLGFSLTNIAIDALFALFCRQLSTSFQGYGEDVTEENIQPRIRATLLMAIANKKRKLLITTGNKSEMSVGYATLYGDMAGGYSVLKDLLKGRVYHLAQARNRWAVAHGEPPPIPQRVLEKAPTAELRPNQKDSDSLPEYPVLDRILELYVEQERSLQEVVDAGIDRDTAVRVMGWVDRNEYKRRQAPPGVRITRRAYGKDRRYPLTNGFCVT